MSSEHRQHSFFQMELTFLPEKKKSAESEKCGEGWRKGHLPYPCLTLTWVSHLPVSFMPLSLCPCVYNFQAGDLFALEEWYDFSFWVLSLIQQVLLTFVGSFTWCSIVKGCAVRQISCSKAENCRCFLGQARYRYISLFDYICQVLWMFFERPDEETERQRGFFAF